MNLRTTCNMMPNQIEGELDDGRPFYFRARRNWWALHVGELGQSVDDFCLNEPILKGYDEYAGWWEPEEAEQVCLNVLIAAGLAA